MATAVPYIFFGGRAEEAMNFYKGVFGAELQTMGYGDMPGAEGEAPPGLMHADLWVDDFRILASDGMPGEPSSPFANPEICISGDHTEEEKLRAQFEALAEGGEITDPLERMFWGDLFGKITDRFGVMWMFNISAEKEAE